MQLALRPYVTTGIALAGAAVIAVSPITPMPTDIQVANPAAVIQRAVGLTASTTLTDAVNAAIFDFVATPTVAGANLLGRLLTPLIGEEQAFLLPIAALGLAGPLISGGGAGGTALQDIVNSDDFEALLLNLVGASGTLLDGLVNGGYGPNLAPLVAAQVAAVIGIPPAALGSVLAGGIIGPGVPFISPPSPLLNFVLPGSIPTLQGLVEQLSGLLGGSETTGAALLAAAPDRDIEDGVNSALYSATALGLQLVTLAAPLVAPILGVSNEEAAGFLALGSLGLLGPLISGSGAAGTAAQDVFNALGTGDFAAVASSLLGAQSTVINGVVNGGSGPNLAPLVRGFLPALPPAQVNPNPPPNLFVQPTYDTVLAGGLINQPGSTVTVTPNPPSLPTIGVAVQLPGTIPTLQGLVVRVFDTLNPPTAPSVITANQQTLKVAATEEAGDTPAAVTPKKRPSLLRNVLRVSPLDQKSDKDDAADAATLGSDNVTTAKHRPGFGKHPVSDLVKRVLGGGHDRDDKKADTSDAEAGDK